MAYEAGTAVLEITPSFRGVEQMLAKGARDIAKGLDGALGDQLGKAMGKAGERAERPSERAGRKLGQVFAERAIKQVETALSNIPQSDRVLKPLREELEALAKIDLGKGFDERDFIKRLERVHGALKRAQQDAQGVNAVGRFTNAGNAAEALGAARQMIEAARRRGFEAGDAWTNAFQTRLRHMRTALPDLKIRADSTDDERQAAAIRARVQAVQALKVGDIPTRDNNPLNLPIGVKIDREDLARELSIIEGLLDNFIERFQNSDLIFPVDKAREQAGAFFNDVKTQAERAAEAEAAAFLKAHEAALAEQHRRDAKARQDSIQSNMDALRQMKKEQQAAQQNTTAGKIRQGVRAAGLAILDLPVRLQTRDIDRQMAEIRSHLLALGDVQINAHFKVEDIADRVEREFQRLRGIAKDQKVNIDVRVDAAAAATELGGILVLLNRIDKDKATVKVDTSGAVAGFAEMLAGLSLNLGRLGAMIALGSSIGTAIVPAAAAAASAIGAIGTAGLAAGAGLGVMLLGFSGIGDAVSAMSKAADSQEKTAVSLGRSSSQVAAAQDQVKSAEMALANTRRNNAQAALRAQRSIRDALESQRDAVRDVARANRDAGEDQRKAVQDVARANQDAVKAQREAVRDVARANRDAGEDQRKAVQDVARANQDALERYGDARHNAAQADLNAARAQEGLNEAYRAARRAIDDLNSSIRGNALDQRQATLDIAKAKEDLNKLLTNPRATEAEIEQARINHEQRLLQMEDLQRKASEMGDEQDKRFAVGIKGSEEVKRAEEQIAAATERSKDAQRAVKRAAEDVTRIRTDGQQRLRDAQEKVDQARIDGQRKLLEAEQRVGQARIDGQRKLRDAEQRIIQTRIDGQGKLRDAQQRVDGAQQAAVDQQKDAAYAVFTANQSLISAQRSLAGAYGRTSVAGGAAMDHVNTAMAKLSPTAQKFAKYLFGLQDAFFALRRAADPMIAGVQKAMESLFGSTSDQAIRRLQPLIDFVGRVATALGDIAQRFAATLQGPTFTRFFNYISRTAVPTLEAMYTAFENLLVGAINLFLAFTPLTKKVTDGFVDMTDHFRRWSETLGSNQGFQRFLGYLRQSGPQMAELLKEVAKAVVALVVAAAPVGTFMVKALTAVAKAIHTIPQEVLDKLVVGIVAASAAMAVFAAATAVAQLSTAGLVAAGIAALVVGIAALVGYLEHLDKINPVLADLIRGVLGVVTGIVALVAAVKVVALVQTAWAATTAWVTTTKAALTLAVVRFQAAVTSATGTTGAFNASLVGLGTTSTATAGSLGAVSAVLGPLGLVLAGIAGVWAVNEWHMRSANEATDDLVPGLEELNKAARDATAGSKGLVEVDKAFRRIVASNGDMKLAVQTLQALGLGMDDISKAMIGNGEAVVQASSAINREIERLDKERNRHFFNLSDNEQRSREQDRLAKLRDALIEVAQKTSVTEIVTAQLEAIQRKTAVSTAALTPAQQALANAQKLLGDSSATAEQKMDALKEAQDAQRDAAKGAINADEEYQRSLLELKTAVTSAKDAHDKHAVSLGKTTDTGLRNRDMLENLIESTNNAYDADVALNGVTQKAIDKHKEHIKQIRAVAKSLGLSKDETNKLIKAFDDVPPDVKTAIGFEGNSFEKMYQKLEQAQFMQEMLAKGKTAKEAASLWSSRMQARRDSAKNPFAYMYDTSRDVRRATGGPVFGAGTATSDSIPAWLSNGEHVLTAAEVRAAGGHEVIFALRRMLLGGVGLPGFAKGGQVRWPFTVGLDRVKVPSLQKLVAAAERSARAITGTLGVWPSSPSAQRGDSGVWHAVLRIIKASGIRSGSFGNAYRPGDPKWHGSGRAVDWMGFNQDALASYLARQRPLELIHRTNHHDFAYTRGRNKGSFNEALMEAHRNHIHVAFDNGGLLPDTRSMPGGVMQVFHGRRTPDKVLTDSQWKSMATLANQARASVGGDTWQFDFKDTTLDEGQLLAIQARRDALNRVNRSNF